MSEEVMKELPNFLRRSLDQLNLSRLNIVLHGGEPLLMKPARVDRLLSSLTAELGARAEIAFAVQTNGVLINDEWISLFEKHQVKVGVSIDGHKHTHDRLRPDHSGAGSYDDTIRGWGMLKSAFNAGRLKRVGALCVVHATTDEDSRTLLGHLVNTLGIASPNLNFPRGGRDSVDAIIWNKASDKHRHMVKSFTANLIEPKFHYVRGIADVLLALYSDRGAERNDRRSSFRHHIATISSAGDLNVDDNLMGIDASLSDSGLTIFGTSLKDLVLGSVWQRLNTAVDTIPAECSGCPWFRSCRSGDLYNRFSRRDGFAGKTVLCDTIKMIHEEVADFLVERKVVKLKELATRLDEAPVVSAADTFSSLMLKPELGEAA